ncbi:hypothetical protein EVAR_93436_1 [Eumeta japonica]|uniref:Uncharacterized protein n=1 Tax=Eumeta variegata TaxID=151549 RepID=A0A4C1TK38_EUMVA|nr:hypothetical protein EVAR_93436_1 [Eumeta japonica]
MIVFGNPGAAPCSVPGPQNEMRTGKSNRSCIRYVIGSKTVCLLPTVMRSLFDEMRIKGLISNSNRVKAPAPYHAERLTSSAPDAGVPSRRPRESLQSKAEGLWSMSQQCSGGWRRDQRAGPRCVKLDHVVRSRAHRRAAPRRSLAYRSARVQGPRFQRVSSVVTRTYNAIAKPEAEERSRLSP